MKATGICVALFCAVFFVAAEFALAGDADGVPDGIYTGSAKGYV